MRPPRKASLLIGCLLMAGAACGEPAMPSVEASATEVTVFVPYNSDFSTTRDVDGWSLEYIAGCLLEQDDIAETKGTLDRVSDFELADEGSTAVFRGPVELMPGPCTIQLRLRDSDGEVIFTASDPYEFDPLPPPELYVVMADGGCPQIPLPDAEGTRKSFCGPVGGVILSAETPAATNVDHIRYTMTAETDPWLDATYVVEGSLEPTSAGAVDLGAGPIETQVWESIVGTVGAGFPYTLELTALDADGAPVCSAQTTLDVTPNSIAQAHVVMGCATGG
mgnify:CR=1 FL=1